MIDTKLMAEFEEFLNNRCAMVSGTEVKYLRRDPFAGDAWLDAKVINVLPNGEVRIKFSDPNLHPQKMTVKPEHLNTLGGRKFVCTELQCPDCAVEWKETPGFSHNYFDCPVCGMKKEDALANYLQPGDIE